MMTTLTPIEAIALLEDGGYITPRCASCADIYKDAVAVAARMTANPAWRPASAHLPHHAALPPRKAAC